MSVFPESPVRRIRVTAQVTFDAFVFDVPDIPERVASEIADAIEYHAPHLVDSEIDSDALIALPEGGSGLAVKVGDMIVEALDEPFDPQDVQDAIKNTRGWL